MWWLAGEGLTQADLEALTQPIPDKFWSRIGRKMSSQRPGGYAPAGATRQQWFHEDASHAAAPGTPTAAQQRPSFTSEVSPTPTLHQQSDWIPSPCHTP